MMGAFARVFGLGGPSDAGGPVAILQGVEGPRRRPRRARRSRRGFSGFSGVGPITRAAATRRVNALIGSCTSGMHRDAYWAPVACIRKALDTAGYNYSISNARYQHDSRGVPEGKLWDLEVKYTDRRGAEKSLFGRIAASGAGSVRDPLEMYDVVAYVG